MLEAAYVAAARAFRTKLTNETDEAIIAAVDAALAKMREDGWVVLSPELAANPPDAMEGDTDG